LAVVAVVVPIRTQPDLVVAVLVPLELEQHRLVTVHQYLFKLAVVELLEMLEDHLHQTKTLMVVQEHHHISEHQSPHLVADLVLERKVLLMVLVDPVVLVEVENKVDLVHLEQVIVSQELLEPHHRMVGEVVVELVLEVDLNQSVAAVVVPVLMEEMVIPHKTELLDGVEQVFKLPQHLEILHKVLEDQDQRVTG
tara:strand:+ start:191 stop:775 length:585 start_codon:yes stop_codon:yes gene_type:complete